MPDGPLPWLIVSMLFILGSFFGASETAFTTCNRTRIKNKADEGSTSAKLVLRILNRLDKMIATILLVNNLIILVSGILLGLFFHHHFGNWGFLLAAAVLIGLGFFVLELFPKSIARANPNLVAQSMSFIIYPFMVILTPITLLYKPLAKELSKIYVMREKPLMTEETFSNVIESIGEQGIIEEEESDIIQSAIDFDELIVKDVLTPREKIVAIDLNGLTHQKLTAFILEHQFSRIPVYQGTLDKIVGVIVVRQYMKMYFANNKVPFSDILFKPYFVDAKLSLDDIFEGFLKNKTHIAFVLDSKKSLIGMVTMEDVLEEIVGQMDERTTSEKVGGSL